MNKDNEYRENAAECERMARLTRDKTDKRSWLDMAQHWRSLISVPPGGSQQPPKDLRPRNALPQYRYLAALKS